MKQKILSTTYIHADRPDVPTAQSSGTRHIVAFIYIYFFFCYSHYQKDFLHCK